MGLEGELFYYCSKGEKDPLEATVCVNPGEIQVIDNANAIVAMSAVNIDDTRATITVYDSRRINGRVCNSGEDEEGVIVDLSKDVILTDGQELSLLKQTKGGSRETILRFKKNDMEYEDLPTLDDRIPESAL